MRHIFYTSALAVLLWQPALANAESLNKQTALESVLRNNPTYQAILAGIDAADGNRVQASLRPNPDAVIEVENFAGTDEVSGIGSAEMTLGIEQRFERGGKRKKRVDVANFAYNTAKMQANVQALRLLAESEYAFIRVAVAQERILLAEKRLNLAKKTHSIVKKRIGAAKASDIQHTKADIEQAAAKVEHRKAQAEFMTAKYDLARLLDMENASDIEVDADLNVLPTLIEKQTLLDALKDTPQLQAQEFAAMQARSSLDLARSQAVPDSTFGLGIRRFNENDNTAFVASLSFPIPVFNRNQGGIQSAKANIVKADAQRDAARLSLKQSAIDAWESLAASLEEAERYQNEIIPSARTAYRQADDGYSRGAFTFLDLLDAQRTLYEVQEARLNSLLDIYKAKVQTDFLTGAYTPFVEASFEQATEGKHHD